MIENLRQADELKNSSHPPRSDLPEVKVRGGAQLQDTPVPPKKPPTIGKAVTLKVLAPIISSALLYGLVPLYAVFLAYAAFYPTCSILVDYFEGQGEDGYKKPDTKGTVSLGASFLFALLLVGVSSVPSLAFLAVYLPAIIAVFAGLEFLYAALPLFKNIRLKKSKTAAPSQEESGRVASAEALCQDLYRLYQEVKEAKVPMIVEDDENLSDLLGKVSRNDATIDEQVQLVGVIVADLKAAGAVDASGERHEKSDERHEKSDQRHEKDDEEDDVSNASGNSKHAALLQRALSLQAEYAGLKAVEDAKSTGSAVDDVETAVDDAKEAADVEAAVDNAAKEGFYLISTVIAMTAVMFGAGFLVEANLVLAAATIAVVGLLSVFAFNYDINATAASAQATDAPDSSYDSIALKLKKFFELFLNPLSTIALASVFGLSGFGFLPALALTNPVFAAVWFVAIVAISSGVLFSIEKADFQQLAWLVTAVLGYIVASLVVNPGVGFVAALGLSVASPVVWAAMIASPVVSVGIFKALSLAASKVNFDSIKGSIKEVSFESVKAGVVDFVTESLKALAFDSLQENKSDQAKAVVNSLTWSAVVYGVTSYIMAPAGTMFVAMLGANVVPALSLAFVVYAAAAGLVKSKDSIAEFAKAKKENTVNLFNGKFSRNKKFGIVLLSLVTLIVGPVLVAFSGMAIFATSIMQALTVATSVIVAVTVWRTLDKALHNNNVKHNNVEANKDSWANIALKALGVILFAAVAYSLAAILPMFAGLVLPTWSALASAFAVVSVPGVFVATISAAYATNIATYYAKGDYQLVLGAGDLEEKKTTDPATAQAADDKAPAQASKARSDVAPDVSLEDAPVDNLDDDQKETPASAQGGTSGVVDSATDQDQGSKARSVDSKSDVVLPDPTPTPASAKELAQAQGSKARSVDSKSDSKNEKSGLVITSGGSDSKTLVGGN